MRYPTVITPEILKAHAHISDDEIAKDLADTLTEIPLKQIEIEGYEKLAQALGHRPDARLNDMRLSVARDTLEHMNEFVAYLKALQAARSAGG